jgi:uroporphyrin-III C-methyltransferase/precorrin-2 dehydrogenase/sirohydrochlorin ferrochelatase
MVGAGKVALRKAESLLKAGANLTVVAPVIVPELEQLLVEHQCRYLAEYWQEQYLEGQMLVVAATSDRNLNLAISNAAAQRNIWVNVVDQPELCSFTFPAIVDRSPVVISISTGGKAPLLSRMIRSQLKNKHSNNFGRMALLMGEFRQAAKRAITDGAMRLRFWEDVTHGPALEMVLAGREKQASQHIEAALEDHSRAKLKGEVWLVGAGPGAPDLLSIKAWRLMQKADVVLYDRLVSQEIVDSCRKDADRIYVGKRMADHAVPQQDINQLLVDLALQGKRVLRLKGGDPFIFGRGGEEIEKLAETAIPFQVVPGITAASGCASYAGIPLTHRDHARSVRFVTAHLKSGVLQFEPGDFLAVDETLVFYMGLVALPQICSGLVEAGREATTPVAIIQQGTTDNQRVLIGTLSDIGDKVQQASIKPPTLLIVGSVVSLHETLNWYQT